MAIKLPPLPSPDERARRCRAGVINPVWYQWLQGARETPARGGHHAPCLTDDRPHVCRTARPFAGTAATQKWEVSIDRRLTSGLFDALHGQTRQAGRGARTATCINQNQTTGAGLPRHGQDRGPRLSPAGHGHRARAISTRPAPRSSRCRRSAQKYGGATDMYLNALGVNGPQGTQAAQNAFQTGPGYQFAMAPGHGGARPQARRPATCTTRGNADQDFIKYGQGMANQEYGNWLKNFQNFINPEAAGDAAARRQGQADGARPAGEPRQHRLHPTWRT